MKKKTQLMKMLMIIKKKKIQPQYKVPNKPIITLNKINNPNHKINKIKKPYPQVQKVLLTTK